jgi:ATP synthase protein I
MPFHSPIPDPKPRSKSKSAFSSWVEAERMMQVALILPCSAMIGWLMGAWLDKMLRQTWISLLGILFGGVSGIVYVVQMATKRAAGPHTGSQPGSGSGDGGRKP